MFIPSYIAISIHALREEGDQSGRLHLPNDTISIHALREEGDCSRPPMWATPTIFLSTPSARRVTSFVCFCSNWQAISIHALREEGDQAGIVYPRAIYRFLSTPSARRVTWVL